MSRLLQVTNVGWRAPGGKTILNRVTFTVEPGEFVALMGRNGAGKSTLLDVLAGVRQPAEGDVLFDGRTPSDWSAAELARTVAHLPQAVRADAPFSAEQLVLMGRYPHAVQWVESAEDRAIAERAMEQCGCLEFRHRRAATLSGGERQRVLLASCFAQQPRLFLLDEPATFLDIDHQFHCFSLLREQVEHGAACLAVTHDINFALTFCTRVVVLADGTLVRDLAVDEAATMPDWLALFSPRLHIMTTPTGRPWVWYG